MSDSGLRIPSTIEGLQAELAASRAILTQARLDAERGLPPPRSARWYGVPIYRVAVFEMKAALRAKGITVADHPDDGLFTLRQRLANERQLRGTMEDGPRWILQGLMVLVGLRIAWDMRVILGLHGWGLGASLLAMAGVGYAAAYPCGVGIRDLLYIAMQEHRYGRWGMFWARASVLALILSGLVVAAVLIRWW